MPSKYRSTLKQADFLTAATPITAGKWVEIGEKKIEAGVYYQMGYGFSSSQSDADGRLYCDFKDSAGAGASLSGKLRIAAYTPDDLPLRTIVEIPTNKMATSLTQLPQQLPFPIDAMALGQDYKFKMFFMADAGGVGNGTLSNANSVINIDVTKTSKAG